MKVLIAASEVAPILKLGGLGDVIGSLPKALEKLQVDADVIVPYFPSAKTQNLKIYKMFEMEVPFNSASYSVVVYGTKLPGSYVDVLLLHNDEYFSNWKTSAFANSKSETEIFAFFDRCVVEYVKSRFNTYNVVHCNDWHTGLLAHLLRDELGDARPGTLFTIHNLMYQGLGDADITREVGFTPGEHPLIDSDIADGKLNLLYQGITSCDFVNAVSESYAKEVLTEEFGKDMSEVLKSRESRLSGILNGIDYTQFPRTYDTHNVNEEKRKLKTALQQKLGLKVTDAPIFSFVSRLDSYQKGLDILFEAIPHVLEGKGQFILLGTGDPKWEERLKEMSANTPYRDQISINITFSVDLANEIYAASDFLIIPSRYEPCGLTQMIAMWYGTLPIVNAVGGLKDTVKNGVNGFSFNGYLATNLILCVTKAFEAYKNKDVLNVIINNAMREDFSWDVSAKVYKDLYQKIIKYRSLNM